MSTKDFFHGRRGPLGRPLVAAGTAAATVLGGIAALGLAGLPAASAATQFTPNCSFGGSDTAIICSQTFTSSTSFSTLALPDWQPGSPLTFQVTGASGGSAADGSAGGQGGTVDETYTPPDPQYDMFNIVIGQAGGNATWTGTAWVAGISNPGAGGAGGGPNGSGAGGPGGNGSEGLLTDGGAGGGGGGATGVYGQAGFGVPGQTAANLVALAPGGGGGAVGEDTIGGGANGSGAPGGNAGQAGNLPPCEGEAGTGTGGGAVGDGSPASSICQGGATAGSAAGGGAGGNASTLEGYEGSTVQEDGGILGSMAGGGGGGGGVYGGGGGDIDYLGTSSAESPASSGGGGGSSLPVVGTSATPSVTVSWQVPDTTTTTVSLSPIAINQGGDVTVTAQAQPTSGLTTTFTGAQVAFFVDGQAPILPGGGEQLAPVPVNASLSASLTISTSELSVGLHTIKAVFYDGSLVAPGTATLDVEGQPSVGLALSGTTGTAGGVSWVVPGVNPTVTASLPANATGTVSFYDNSGTNTVPVVNGTASEVLNSASIGAGIDYITAIYNSTSDLYSDTGSQSLPLNILGPDSLGSAGMVWTFAKDGASSPQLLEVNDNSTADGGTVDTWQQVTSNGNVQGNEAWVYQPSTTNPAYGELVNQNSGLCLELNGTSGVVDQWQCENGATNELWQEVTNPTGGDSLQNLASGQYLATTSANGAAVSSGNGNALTLQSAQSAYTAWTANPGSAPTLAPAGAVWSFAKTGATGTQLLEVNGATSADGATVDTWQQVLSGNTNSPVANEAWVYQPSANSPGFGELVNQNSGLCLERNGSSGVVDQWQCGNSSANQLWAQVANPTGGISLQNLYTGQYLGTTTANGAPVSSGDGNALTLQSTQSAYTGWTDNA
jgi:hypothetical protein